MNIIDHTFDSNIDIIESPLTVGHLCLNSYKDMLHNYNDNDNDSDATERSTNSDDRFGCEKKEKIKMHSEQIQTSLESPKSWLINNKEFTDIKFVNLNNIQFYICNTLRSIIFVFRGTDSIKDFFVDMKLSLTTTPYGKIHSGFYDGWIYIRDFIYSEIQIREAKLNQALHDRSFCNQIVSPLQPAGAAHNTVCRHTPYTARGAAEHIREVSDQIFDKVSQITIKFFGHSYGGALATIGALGTSCDLNKHVHCQTIGSPRVGDKSFVKKYKQHVDVSKRFFNSNDVVIKFPTGCKYRHVHNKLDVTQEKLCCNFYSKFCCCKIKNPHTIEQYMNVLHE